jgi:hypothetical protein
MSEIRPAVKAGACSHAQTAFFRPFHGGYHVVELCLTCHENARGGGVWVARRELPRGCAPATLPLAPGCHPSADQPGLFDTLGGGRAEA